MPEPGKAAVGTHAEIDTHKDFHVVAVVDHLGRLLDTHTAKTTDEGYRQLLQWLSPFTPIIRVGVEGTGSYGAAVTATLGERGFDVVEVNRPNRQMRRFRGKTTPSMPKPPADPSSPNRRARSPSRATASLNP